MAILTINDNPSITDTIIFNLATPDANGCLLNNPYKVDKIVIYYVERDFTSNKLSEYDNKTYDLSKLQNAIETEALACSSPTAENIAAAKFARNEAEASVVTTPFFFNEATPIQIVGNDQYPAWLSTDLDNAFLDQAVDENDNPLLGQFTYTWEPIGAREGDYFICWTWTPNPAGDSLSSHTRFILAGDTQVTTSIPTHYTNPNKYPTLLDRYTPEMFKMIICDDDRTPDVLDKLNGAISLGLNTLEDLTNQMVDLQDANSLHESLLPYLSNFFDLKLKTNDPTRWRGQIKRAVPLFKMKGTKKGLSEAFDLSGITMLGLNQLWEIISSYTWQDVFVYTSDTTFTLTKFALPVDFDNFGLWIRAFDSDIWTELTSDYVEFTNVEGVSYMTWTGNTLSVDPIDLIAGDELRVLYKYNDVPDMTAQNIEIYIRSLPLMDQRDERDQIYPFKNWNVRVIQENDSMFNLVIPNRHPFHDPIVYGKVRTEFPYSENIYNMEEYNGSIRNSKDPCDIDRTFLDPCTACISSSYNIDLEIENISDDRILEAKEVLKEHTPFHSVLHTFNFVGGINEFVESPIEDIEILVTVLGSEYVIAGEAQMWFNRVMKLVETNGILRSELADSSIVVPTTTAIGYNDNIVMFCPTTKLDNLGMITDGTAQVHILSPSPLEGVYLADSPKGNVVNISSMSEPIADCNNLFASDGTINSCAFTFDINNPVLDGTLCDIAQDNVFTLSDLSQDFGLLMTKSTFDVDHGTASTAWKVLIPVYDAVTAYTIKDILPSGELLLTDHGGLPANSASGLTYHLMNGLTTVEISTSGNLGVVKRGRVTVLNSGLLPISNILKIEDFYHIVGSDEFPVIEFVSGTNDQYYIGNYQDGMGGNRGDINSADLKVFHKIVTGEVGYLSHRGLKLKMSGNLESDLGIQNGVNSLVVVDDGIENDGFKENFIVSIDSDNYFIAEIDGNNPPGYTTITLSGVSHYWKTLDAGGTSVNVTIYQYTKNGATIMGQQFDLPSHTFRTLDRNGRPVIDATFEDGTVESLSIPNGNEMNDFIRQNESINFTIEYADGSIEQGEVQT